MLAVATLLCVSVPAHAQVALDSVSTASGDLTAAPGNTLTFSHTSTGTNLVLVVGVSLNISGRNSTTIGTVTYGGASLTPAGAAITNSNRVSQIFYLIGPATGAHNVVVPLNISGGGTIGIVAGAVTFTGADQTTPIRTYITNSGNSANPFVNVASSSNDMVMDTLTVFAGNTASSTSPAQTQQWSITSGTGGGSDAYGSGSTRQGAASVPMSETLSGSTRWAEAAVSVQPSQSDLSISVVAGSATHFPTNVTYTVTVKNSGPSGATGVTATLTMPSGLTLVSAVPSQGSGCSGTTTITCSLGSIAKDSTATITVTATPSVPGGYVLSGTVSSTSADLNNSNNSASAVAYSEFDSCATTTTTAGGNLTGVINTYYPGTATASAGSTSITLGTATGAGTPIGAGDLVLIMQMQDAAINTSNNSQYGDGISGSGSTSLNNAGVYEYATAVNGVPTSGGTLTVTAAGPGGGLLYTYTAAAASASQGARNFQVIRVPNYTTATLTSGLTASAWNGSTGGVLALNTSSTLTLGGANISVDGLGFRGAAGLFLTGTTGAASADYLFTAPTIYDTTTLTSTAGADGSKGEGIAGTPEWVENVTSVNGSGTVTTGTVSSTGQSYPEGYPLGSMARGAPGNAGGGGTDADPANNDQNTGGGGGANGGGGGQGGNSWNTNLSTGGLGGTAFPASSSRVVMGGGGGAGSSNNNSNFMSSSGAPGGGIVMIRAAIVSGTVTITANGYSAYNATPNDGGGGGGAGGSIVFLYGTVSGATTATLTANGGRGGDAWDAGAFSNANRHGPGGGGGGGAVLYSTNGAGVTASVTGGANGVTLNNASASYGATSGSSGVNTPGVSLDSSPGPHSASGCADVGVTKTASPNPVIVNNTLTYTITVTNNTSTAAASNVSVVDTIPAQVTYVSSSISGGTGGSCSQSAGVLTCTFGSLAASASATINVTTTANTPYSLAVNTVIVNSSTPDPNTINNTASVSVAIEGPTSVRVNSFSVSRSGSGVLLEWNTGGEIHNLGFNVYRDVNGQKTQLNPSLIAGSALLMREALEQHTAKAYGWIDPAPMPGAVYWLEDVDLDGTRTLHGPISVQASSPTLQVGAKPMVRVTTLQDLARPVSRMAATSIGAPPAALPLTHVREAVAKPVNTPTQQQIGFALAARPAVKIFVDHEGWYRVTQPQLIAAGLSPNVDARSLRLFAEGVEQPIRVLGGDLFGPQSAIEFYGTAIDTPYSGQRVYWLTSQGQPGQRIATESENGSAGPSPASFWQTVELKPRTTYFAALLREDTDNFFGPVISTTSTTQTLNVANLAPSQTVLDVTLQGVTEGQQHDVTVAMNGATLGDLSFAGQQEGRARFTVPSGILVNGANALTFTAQQGSNDFSLIDTIDVSYRHTYTAESDQLKFSAEAGALVTVTGFSQPPTRLIDVTNAQQPFAVSFQSSTAAGTYSLTTQVPWTSSGTHWMLALTDAQIATPVMLAPHNPSNLHAVQRGSEVVLLAAPQFATQFQSVADLRRAQGKSVAEIDIDAVYDEFNFGERTPYAVRDFLRTATVAWKQKPRYLLLGGDASIDPRNYLGFGYLDFVPTKIVVTQELKTASDDWFSDFNNTGFAQIATGRLPALTTSDAQIMTGKIVGYDTGQPGSWTNDSLVVADVDSPGVNFTQAAQSVQNALPLNMNVTGVFATSVGVGTARQQILSGMNAGQLFVNYNGHGSVQIWGSNLFDDTAASTLTNGSRLPFVVAMNCLNGFFHDVYTESLATALMISPNGGAVAVWASSGLTAPSPQFQMDQILVRTLAGSPGMPIGDAVMLAKSGIADQDVRRTFILFGDPSMRLKWPQGIAAPASVKRSLAK